MAGSVAWAIVAGSRAAVTRKTIFFMPAIIGYFSVLTQAQSMPALIVALHCFLRLIGHELERGKIVVLIEC